MVSQKDRRFFHTPHLRLLPHAHVQGVKQLVCMSVIVVVVVVRTKIASLGDLGP